MISALFAVDQAGGMGWNGSLPWPQNKDDMMWFKQTTQNEIVVMGRRTWDSPDMPKPLPGRHNIVFTSRFFDNDLIDQVSGDVCEMLLELKKSNKKRQIYVIGGPALLMQALPVIESVFLTKIPGEYLSDVKINLEEFLAPFSLKSTANLRSCVIQEYQRVKQSTH